MSEVIKMYDPNYILSKGDVVKLVDKNSATENFALWTQVYYSQFKLITIDSLDKGNRYSDAVFNEHVTLDYMKQVLNLNKIELSSIEEMLGLNDRKVSSIQIEPELNDFIYGKKKYVIVNRYYRPRDNFNSIIGNRGITCIFKIDYISNKFECLYSICSDDTFSKEQGLIKAQENYKRKIVGKYYTNNDLYTNLYLYLINKDKRTSSESRLLKELEEC